MIAVTLPLHIKLLISLKKLLLGISVFLVAHLGASAYFTAKFVVEDFHDENNTLLYSSCISSDELTVELQYFAVFLDMIIPLAVIVVGNIIIAATVLVKRMQMSGMTSGSGYQAGEMRLVATTVSISLSSVILTSPLALYYTLGEAVLEYEVFVDWTNPLFVTCDTLFYTNFAVNFFLYMAFTSSFREGFGVVLRKCTGRRGSPQVSRNDLNESVAGTSGSSVSTVSQSL